MAQRTTSTPVPAAPGSGALESAFAPWRYMLAVDEVNYDLDELVALADRRPATEVINLASGVNLVDPPAGLVSFVVGQAAEPLFWHDYDGPHGHLVGRAAVAAAELARGDARLRLDPRHVIVTAGASAALTLAARGLRHAWPGPADRPAAVLGVPTFPLAGACLAEAGFTLVEVAGSEPGRWLPTPEELIAAAPPATRVVYLNTFNNPTGEFYRAGELARLVRWAREHRVALLHDTVSSDVAGADPLPHLLSIAAAEGYQDGVLTVGSLSKTRALPGFRVGWLIAAPDLVHRLAAANELAAPSSPAVAAPALLLDRVATTATGLELESLGAVWQRVVDLLEPYHRLFPGLGRCLDAVAGQLAAGGVGEQLLRWRTALRDLLATNAEVVRTRFSHVVTDLPAWHGDFNTFVRVPALTGHDHLATTHRLFREHGLQTLPAPVFGFDEAWWSGRGYHARLSFALPTEVWIQGLTRLDHAVRAVARG